MHWNVFLKSTYFGRFLMIILFCVVSFGGCSYLWMSLAELGKLMHFHRTLLFKHFHLTLLPTNIIKYILEWKIFKKAGVF